MKSDYSQFMPKATFPAGTVSDTKDKVATNNL